MSLREANPGDIDGMMEVRMSVKENVLSTPGLVTNEHCYDYITNRGKGWVYEREGKVVGFAIADLVENNIWALFVHPDYEKQGIGRQLHDKMIDWYFSQTKKMLWLSTAPESRAATFYRNAGWNQNGIYGKGELKFEMTFEKWKEAVHLKSKI